MPITPEQQQQLEHLFDEHDVAVAYVFGSQARGTARRTSDTDIALLFTEEASQNQQLRREGLLISELKKVIGTAIDLVDLQTVKSPLLKHRAVIRGELLYCADEGRRRQLEQRIFHEYEDTQYLRAVQNQTLHRRIKNNRFGKHDAR